LLNDIVAITNEGFFGRKLLEIMISLPYMLFPIFIVFFLYDYWQTILRNMQKSLKINLECGCWWKGGEFASK
jgi:hypothetical protein